MSKKKKILLLSDDLRMHSGIATVSKDIVMETLNEYDWVQIVGLSNILKRVRCLICLQGLEDFGIKNGYLKVYPTDGYGDPPLLREVMEDRKTRCHTSLHRSKFLDLVIQNGSRDS